MQQTRILIPLVALVLLGALLSPDDDARADARVEDPGAFQITPTVGVQVGGSFAVQDGKISFDAGPSAGARLAYRVRDDGLVFLSYHFARVPVSGTGSASSLSSSKADSGFLQFGGELEFPSQRRLEPLIGLSVGAVHIAPSDGAGGRHWFFAGTFYGGVNYRLTRNIGLRAEARMLATVISGNTSFFCSSNPGGCLISVDAEGMLQGDFSAGLYLRF